MSDKEIAVFPEFCTLEECDANCGNQVCAVPVPLLYVLLPVPSPSQQQGFHYHILPH